MSETYTIRDPFLGKNVEISSKLVDRLRGKYACGPTMPNGEPEFGWRQFETAPVQHEAADRIEALVKALEGTLCELSCLAMQMAARGWPGREGDSVSRAQKAARDVLAAVGGSKQP